MSTPIEQRGYAHPETLVSTDWVEQHLNDPKVRLVESNEDTLLYASGHVPGAVHVDWTSDLNDQVRRDYITREGFESLILSWDRQDISRTPPSSSTATRTTGGPATRSGSSSSSATPTPR